MKMLRLLSQRPSLKGTSLARPALAVLCLGGWFGLGRQALCIVFPREGKSASLHFLGPCARN
jgi:hypothetical protein